MSTTSPPLCTAADCWVYGRHTPGCDLVECTGCMVRLAADGLYLCRYHRDRLKRDALSAATLYSALGERLEGATTERYGEMVSGTPTRSPTVDERVVAARTLIRHTMVAWCRLVAEERGHSLPKDTLPAMAAFLARNADWLAAREYAQEACGELHELAWGMPRRAAYPSGARLIDIGPCPIAFCPGSVTAVLRPGDSLLPSVLSCGAGHEWNADRWRELEHLYQRAGLVDTATLAVRLGVSPGQIRLWVHQQVTSPLFRAGSGRGRPSMWFRCSQVDEDLHRAGLDHLSSAVRYSP